MSGHKCTNVIVTNGCNGSSPLSYPKLRSRPAAKPGRTQLHKHVALSARVSSDRQVEEGTIDSQLASLQTYSDDHGYTIDADMIFLDDGFSGATLARPGLDALRDRAVMGALDEVLVLAPDRFARNHAHQLILIDEFQRLGVEIIFINRPIAQSPEDHLLLQMQGVMAEFEREQILERSRRGKLHKAKQGQVSV